MVGDEQIKESFRRVKEDISNHEAELSSLKQEVKGLRFQLDSVLPSLLQTNKQILSRLESIEAGMGRRKDPIKEQMLNKFNRKRKDVVMAKIVELVSQRDYTLAELRGSIVDELGYASRASFYRYIDVLKRLGRLEPLTINGVEIVKLLQSSLT
jgi:GTP cyclohydrolase I